MSVALLCNKLVPTRYRSRACFLPDIRTHYSQDTATETSVRSSARVVAPSESPSLGYGELGEAYEN